MLRFPAPVPCSCSLLPPSPSRHLIGVLSRHPLRHPLPASSPGPHLRQTSPARLSACRRGHLPPPSAASSQPHLRQIILLPHSTYRRGCNPHHRQHPSSRICGKTPSHLTPRADAALFIRKRTDFPAASAFRIASTVLFPQMRPAQEKKPCISGQKSTWRNSVRTNFFLFCQLSTNSSHTIISSTSANNYPTEKKRRKNKMHAFFSFQLFKKESSKRKTA